MFLLSFSVFAMMEVADPGFGGSPSGKENVAKFGLGDNLRFRAFVTIQFAVCDFWQIHADVKPL